MSVVSRRGFFRTSSAAAAAAAAALSGPARRAPARPAIGAGRTGVAPRAPVQDPRSDRLEGRRHLRRIRPARPGRAQLHVRVRDQPHRHRRAVCRPRGTDRQGPAEVAGQGVHPRQVGSAAHHRHGDQERAARGAGRLAAEAEYDVHRLHDAALDRPPALRRAGAHPEPGHLRGVGRGQASRQGEVDGRVQSRRAHGRGDRTGRSTTTASTSSSSAPTSSRTASSRS